MKKTNTSFLAAILCAFPLLSQAFVSYSDNTSSTTPVLGTNPYPQSYEQTLITTPMKNTSSTSVGRSKEILRMTCHGGGPYSNVSKSTLAETKNYSGQAALAKSALDLAPVGWNVHDLSGSQGIATWDINGTWMQALSQAAGSVGGCAFIDWKTKKITLIKNRNEAGFTAKVDNSMVSASTKNPFTLPAATASVSPNLWTLTTDKTLKQNLLAWGERSGWRVVWKIKNMDFKITQTATLSGDFLEAIEQILEAYENGNTPIAVNLYESNRVVEFVDHTPFKRNIIQ